MKKIAVAMGVLTAAVLLGLILVQNVGTGYTPLKTIHLTAFPKTTSPLTVCKGTVVILRAELGDGEDGVWIRFYKDGAFFKGGLSANGGVVMVEFETADYPAGTYTFQAKANDYSPSNKVEVNVQKNLLGDVAARMDESMNESQPELENALAEDVVNGFDELNWRYTDEYLSEEHKASVEELARGLAADALTNLISDGSSAHRQLAEAAAETWVDYDYSLLSETAWKSEGAEYEFTVAPGGSWLGYFADVLVSDCVTGFKILHVNASLSYSGKVGDTITSTVTVTVDVTVNALEGEVTGSAFGIYWTLRGR